MKRISSILGNRKTGILILLLFPLFFFFMLGICFQIYNHNSIVFSVSRLLYAGRFKDLEERIVADSVYVDSLRSEVKALNRIIGIDRSLHQLNCETMPNFNRRCTYGNIAFMFDSSFTENVTKIGVSPHVKLAQKDKTIKDREIKIISVRNTSQSPVYLPDIRGGRNRAYVPQIYGIRIKCGSKWERYLIDYTKANKYLLSRSEKLCWRKIEPGNEFILEVIELQPQSPGITPCKDLQEVVTRLRYIHSNIPYETELCLVLKGES